MAAPDDYIRELAQAVTAQEDLTDADSRRELLELAYRLRALLLTLPEGALARQLEYTKLRPRIYREIQYTVSRLRPIILTALEPVEQTTLAAAARLFSLEPTPPRDLPTIVGDTRIQFQTLNTLLLPRPSSGLSDLTLQLFDLLDKTVRAAFLRGDTTAELGDRLVQVRTRRTRQVPVLTKGTVANGWRSRLKAIVAAALWTIAYANQQRMAAQANRTIEEWRWNAVLDPKTCPVCRPLDGTTAPFPAAFPEGPPPLHPFCRCVVIPVYAA